MKYLLIAFVIFVALAPLSHFVPSKRQRLVARLREFAAVHGLFVEFRQLPGAERDNGRSPAARGDIIYYGKRLPPARRGQLAQSGAWLQDEEGWRGITPGQRAVPAVLLPLSPDILAASVDEGSCGVYWRETTGEATVEQILETLGAWSSELRPN